MHQVVKEKRCCRGGADESAAVGQRANFELLHRPKKRKNPLNLHQAAVVVAAAGVRNVRVFTRVFPECSLPPCT